MGGIKGRVFAGFMAVISVTALNIRASADDLYVAVQNATGIGAIDEISAGGVVKPFVSGLDNPSGLSFGPNGTLYVSLAPTRSTVVVDKVSPAGVVSPFSASVPGDYLHGSAFDIAGNLFVGLDSFGLTRISPDGFATPFATADGQGVAFDSSGNLFSAATVLNGVYKTSPAGVSQPVMSIDSPIGLAFDHLGNLFISSEDDDTITELAPSGNSKAYASFASSVSPFAPDATVDLYGLAFDSHGTLYVAESDGTNGAIGIVTSGGTIQTYATFPGVPIFIADPSVSLVPEPVSLSLLALGGITLLARRSRATDKSN